jgi:hypothetical protein
LTTRRYLNVLGSARTAQTRIVYLYGVKHIVVPVVALLGDVIVRPLGSRGPELVPASELQLVPQAWNGRPVVLGHPYDGTVSANDPAVLDAYAFGTMFFARYDTGALQCDAYLNTARAEQLGGSCVDLLVKCINGEAVEVSVGAYVTLIESPGVHNGQPYIGYWSGIVPDHLAFLPEGQIGACSIDMGCGAMRAAIDRTLPTTTIQTTTPTHTTGANAMCQHQLFGFTFGTLRAASMAEAQELAGLVKDELARVGLDEHCLDRRGVFNKGALPAAEQRARARYARGERAQPRAAAQTATTATTGQDGAGVYESSYGLITASSRAEAEHIERMMAETVDTIGGGTRELAGNNFVRQLAAGAVRRRLQAEADNRETVQQLRQTLPPDAKDLVTRACSSVATLQDIGEVGLLLLAHHDRSTLRQLAELGDRERDRFVAMRAAGEGAYYVPERDPWTLGRAAHVVRQLKARTGHHDVYTYP